MTATSKHSGTPPAGGSSENGSDATEGRWISSHWSVWFYGVPIAVLMGGLLHYMGHGPFQNLEDALARENALHREVEQLESENDALQKEIDLLMPGRFGVEKRAREQLGWSRPGEYIVRIAEKR